jgi:hypothetical protein
MKTKLLPIIGTLLIVSALAGCGPSREEVERRERERLEAEKQAQREIQRSNEAVNEVSKKLGRKPPSLDLGLPPEKKDEPAKAEPKQP